MSSTTTLQPFRLGNTRLRAALLALALIGFLIIRSGNPVVGAPAAPPNNTFEITITGNTVAAPGGTLSFEGTCWATGFGPAQEAEVRGYRLAGPGIGPFDFWITIAVNQSTAGFSGTIAIPGNTPNGVYRLEVTCSTQDQRLGSGETPFTVDGPLITTTSTSTTTSSTTTSNVPSGLTAVPTPVPARPLRGTATLTG